MSEVLPYKESFYMQYVDSLKGRRRRRAPGPLSNRCWSTPLKR